MKPIPLVYPAASRPQITGHFFVDEKWNEEGTGEDW
jgi:hypothetical protein